MWNNENTGLDLAACPQCAAPAEILDRFDLPSSDGPVEHVKVQCLSRHRFTMPAAGLRADRVAGARFAEEVTRWNRDAA
jgi:hypothetical protein